MMRRILFTLLVFVACMAAEAKTIKITLADGTVKVFTTSQLDAIDFNDDGTLTITTFDGEVLEALGAEFDELTVGYEDIIYEEVDDVLSFEADVDGLPVDLNYDRDAKRLNYVYTSTDPFGEPITLSGSILIPTDIMNGEKTCQGIILYDHYTIFNRTEAPTRGFATLEGMLLANPLTPDYIIVESDFYGFGVTERFPQAFLQGTHNARANLDALLAARQLLDERGFNYGPLTFNVGYSSGGFDALAVQKLRDMEYSDRVSFDKTFAGGSPSDIKECYRQYVTIDRTAYNAVPLLLMLSTNETLRLGLTYEQVFQPDIVPMIDEYVMSKNYSSWPVCDAIGREKMVHEILSDTYCDLNSPESQYIQEVFQDLSIPSYWTPDPSQKLYIFHSRADDYVPVQAARPVLRFLEANGFEASIVPGATNLQTNFVVPKLGHLSATLIYLIQTVAALKAWPTMYTNGQLNPVYQQIVSEKDPVELMRYLDSMGFDCRGLIKTVIEQLPPLPTDDSGQPIMPIDTEKLQAAIQAALAQLGLTEQDLVEMSQDSGIDLMEFIMELIAYFNEEQTEEPVEPEDAGSAPFMEIKQQLPTIQYEQELRQWIEANNTK